MPVAYQVSAWLDETDGFFVPVKSVRSAWDSMASELGLPGDGAGGMKLLRRSMAKLLRDRLSQPHWEEVSMFLGHTKFDNTSDIYAPFETTYLANAKREIEAIIDEIEARVPGAFHRSDTGVTPNVVPIKAAKNA